MKILLVTNKTSTSKNFTYLRELLIGIYINLPDKATGITKWRKRHTHSHANVTLWQSP